MGAAVSFQFEARFFCDILAQQPAPPARVLIIGCGRGAEARAIAETSGASVFGLDLHVGDSGGGAHLMRADARRLPFPDGVFDAAYCYHVLEHVPGPAAAVAEARRVLKPGAVAFFGTPNKARLVGYLGGRGGLGGKVMWNLADYWMRLTGRWSNDKGAHAGFTERELSELVLKSFGSAESVSLPYYLSKYPTLAGMWRTSFRIGLGRLIAPSVYVRAV